eukprot:TRINITY_DN24418_c0_g1_i1.p1 TRINITY_DN24418_c0_g1~~TRINITY_DN24418_c0_g1_i1.p1  ORF type:complete len:535 (+),score=67.63 TRINITY_DN24418_c0_g1_i1:72-1607(+)
MVSRSTMVATMSICVLLALVHQMSGSGKPKRTMDEVLGISERDIIAAEQATPETTPKPQTPEPVRKTVSEPDTQAPPPSPAPIKKTTQTGYQLTNGEVLGIDSRPWILLKTELQGRLAAMPPTPDAPEGDEAMDLARSWGFPDTWNARHHPTNFILGAPKAGTTFLERCYTSGGLAAGVRRPYPKPALRWPLFSTPTGEPIIRNTAFISSGVWNRTGYRRWDLQKEPRVYRRCGPVGSPTYYKLFEAFPPVEPDTKEYDVLDATPTYIHAISAIESVYNDFKHDLSRPRFVVGIRDGLDRAFSHFVMIASMQSRKQTAARNIFLSRMNDELSIWDRPVCRVLKTNPESLLGEDGKDDLAKVLRSCFSNPSYLGLSLPVLGLRYWLHHFSASQFTAVRIEALKKEDPNFALDLLASAFNHTRLPPVCPPGNDAAWKTGSCTGPTTWNHVKELCSDPRASGRNRQASYSSKADTLGLSKGTEEETKPWRELFSKFDAMLVGVLKEHKVRFIEE